MSQLFVRSFRRAAITGVALAAMAPALASAQDAAPEQEEAAALETEIVVTGTLVRGVAPPGANVVGVTADAIQQTGATNVAQVLQTIPQLGSFGTLQAPLSNSGEVVVNRPNLRSLPGFNTSGGSSTLVLMDGHRLVGMGTASTSPDPDIIPPGVLERIEIVPDGGSAIYGSDAVAGVMNFITIKRFDGVKVDASAGVAEDYYQWNANVTAGKDWGSGSLFLSYNYAKTDDILGKDRDYVREYRNTDGFTTLACGAGNVQNLLNSAYSGLPIGSPVVQGCDLSDYATVFPKSERHSVFGGLTQRLDDTLTFELRGYYTKRTTDLQDGGPYRTDLIISTLPGSLVPGAVNSPFLAENTFGPAERLYFQFGDNDSLRSHVSLETWGVSPTFTKQLGGSWRVRLLGNYGESTTIFTKTGINGAARDAAIRTGTINPFNLADARTPNSAAALAAITNWQTYSKGRQSLTNVRGIIDGDLFTLPGGSVKVAIGGEYSHETLRTQNGDTVPGFENSGFAGAGLIPSVAPLPRFDLSRNVKSVFGELIVPIFGTENAMGGFEELNLSIAGRYDDYSDFGDTFNPKIGLTWKPIDWVSVRGTWGKSFNAPSLADDDAAALTTLFTLSGSGARSFAPPAALQGGNPYPNYGAGGRTQIVAVRGNQPGIEPQKATTWSLGIDIQPPFASGLSLSVSYYNIDFKGYISVPPFEAPATLWNNFGSVITVNDGGAAFQNLLAQATASANVCRDAASNIPCTVPNAATVYAFFDGRKQNLGDVKVDGFDFSANYRMDTGFGALFLGANGTYTLNFKRRAGSSVDYVQEVTRNVSRFKSRATIGADIGNLTAQATWTHLHGYKLSVPLGYNNPAAGFFEQSRVGSFNTVDLFFRYDLKGEGLAQDLAFTLNVNNVFDQDPPVFIGSNQVAGRLGYANGATLGRFFQIGLSKRF